MASMNRGWGVLALATAAWLLLTFVGAGGASAHSLALHENHDEATPVAGDDAGSHDDMDGRGGHDHDAPMGEPTAAEQAAADALVDQSQAAAARFEDVTVAEAEGYRQIVNRAPGSVGPAHYVNPRYMADGALLDPERPEALVYWHSSDGNAHLLGVMYIADPGAGPTPGGPLTHWHGHAGSCIGSGGFGQVDENGNCPAGLRPIVSEMMHVWTFDHPGGALAEMLGPEGRVAAAQQFGR